MPRTIIHSEQAPAAIGTYSQAVRVGSTVYLSGQTPLERLARPFVNENLWSTARDGRPKLSQLGAHARVGEAQRSRCGNTCGGLSRATWPAPRGP